jgi:hypothetical protein
MFSLLPLGAENRGDWKLTLPALVLGKNVWERFGFIEWLIIRSGNNAAVSCSRQKVPAAEMKFPREVKYCIMWSTFPNGKIQLITDNLFNKVIYNYTQEYLEHVN